MKLLGQAWTRPHHLEAILMACEALSVDNRPVTTTMTICPVYPNELQGVWVATVFSSAGPGCVRVNPQFQARSCAHRGGQRVRHDGGSHAGTTARYTF